MQIPEKYLLQQIVHITVALLEAKQIGQGRCVGGDAEAVRFIGTHRNPRNGDIETVKVVGGAELGGGKTHRHNIKSRGGLYAHPGSEFDIAAHIDGLGEAVIHDQFLGGLLVRV